MPSQGMLDSRIRYLSTLCQKTFSRVLSTCYDRPPAAAREGHTYPPNEAEEQVVYRVWIIGLAVSLGVVQGHLALAVVSGSAPEHVERGYALVAQARLEAESATRERLLSGAIAAFKEAYQSEPTDPPSQVQALLGAAQASLLVQSPRRVFPFLWQATPLQRAEKSLQQALVLQPDNAAAALLLGIVYWRQATQAAGQQRDIRARSTYYLTQAAALGLPIALAPPPERHESPVTLFSVEDTIVALRYIDARGVGRLEDLLFIYRSAASEPLLAWSSRGGRHIPSLWIPPPVPWRLTGSWRV